MTTKEKATEAVADLNAAPDAATAAAAKVAAEDKVAGKLPEQIEADAAAERERKAEERAKTKQKHYRTVHGGIMIDPDTGKSFNSENAIKSPLTPWLEFQIANGKIAEDE